MIRRLRHTTAIAPVAILLGAILVTAACGGSGDNNSTPSTASRTPAARTASAASTPTAARSPSASATGSTGGGPGAAVAATVKSYSITLDKSTVAAGSVQFNITNQANISHEFIIFKTDLAADNLPVSGGTVDASSSQLTKVDEEEPFPKGEKTLTVNLQPGHYVLICNLPGHYQNGMHASLTVQ
jgi:uncharacterized cupredoxin-like copper-binding protein